MYSTGLGIVTMAHGGCPRLRIALLRGHSSILLNILDTRDAVNFGLECADLAIGGLLLDPKT